VLAEWQILADFDEKGGLLKFGREN